MFFSRKSKCRAASRRLKIALCLMSFFLAMPAFANEGGEGGEKKAEGGEGHGGAAAGESDKPWVGLQNQVLTLKTRRLQLLQNMTAIREEKSQRKESSAEIKGKVDEMAKIYKEYKEVTEEYNKLLIVLKYRFPERLAKEDERDYKPIEVESLDKMSEQLDIESRLTKVYQKAQSQYGSETERKPASAPPSEKKEQGGSTIREQNPLLLNQ